MILFKVIVPDKPCCTFSRLLLSLGKCRGRLQRKNRPHKYCHAGNQASRVAALCLKFVVGNNAVNRIVYLLAFIIHRFFYAYGILLCGALGLVFYPAAEIPVKRKQALLKQCKARTLRRLSVMILLKSGASYSRKCR